MSSSVVTLTIEDDLAIVTISNPPVNATSHSVREGLADAILQTNENQAIRAVLLTCTGSTFVAGADIKEFGKPPLEPTLSDVISAIENARVPWVAVINGAALGGGLELTLGCRFRVASAKASVGLPEVNLGLIPGAGGTYRLPRLMPMQGALNLITSGKPISASQAKANGLVDEVFAEELLSSAKTFARSTVLASDREPVCQLDTIEPLSTEAADKAIADAMHRKQFAKTAAITTVTKGAAMPVADAAKLAVQTFQELRDSDQSRALRHLFFAERSVSKIATLKHIKPREINVVGIIGGGTMGTGIASSALLHGLHVVLIEQDDTTIENARSKVLSILDAAVSRKLLSPEQYNNAVANFSTDINFKALSEANLVIEAVFEDPVVKRDVFAKLDEVTKPSAILATNTSYGDVAALAKQTKDPSRVIGLHYFSPAHIMKLLEVIRTDFVAPDVLATALQFAKRTGKIAVPAGNCRGFIANRIMSAYRQAAEYLIEDGALPFQVDSAMKNYGFPMGIFEMQDLAGLDIGWAMRKQLSAEEKTNIRYVDIPDKICEENRFGRKTGSGYYQYQDGKTAERDEWVEKLIEQESTRKGINRRNFSESDIMTTILQRIKSEADSILLEGIADSSEAIDVVMVNAFGFPRWRGGPMHAASVT